MCININVTDGLANGAAGVVKRIQLSSYNSLNASGVVWILFDGRADRANDTIQF